LASALATSWAIPTAVLFPNLESLSRHPTAPAFFQVRQRSKTARTLADFALALRASDAFFASLKMAHLKNLLYKRRTAVAGAYLLRGQKSLAFTVAFGDRKTILINKDCSLAKRLFRKAQQTFVLTPPPNNSTADCSRT